MNVYEFLKFLSASDKEALEVYRPLAHQRVVITGALAEHVTRDRLTDVLTLWGAVVDTKVTLVTDVLLAVEPERMTQKRKDAARYGVAVMDEHSFTAWLKDARTRAVYEAAGLAASSAPVPPPEWFSGVEEFVDDIAPLSDLEG